MSVKTLRKQLFAAIAMVLVAAIALGSSTYAWFVNNATVTATGANVQAATTYNLLISNDGTNFYTTTELDNALTNLTPVSTNGTLEETARAEVTTGKSDATNKFDLLFATSNAWKDNHVISFTEVGKNTVVSGSDKYYYNDTIYLKAAQDGSIYIDINETGVVWNGKQATFAKFMTGIANDGSDLAAYSDGGSSKTSSNYSLAEAKALLSTLRVGFVVTTGSGESEAKVGTYFYQLTDTNLTGNTNSTAISATDTGDGANGVTGAVSIAPADHAITVATNNITTTTITNATSNSVPVISGLSGVQQGIATATSSDVAIVSTATANTVYTVDTYIWMEGCDVDTVANTLSLFTDGGITGMQFGFCLGEIS